MEKITELLNNFSLEKYIPKLDSVMGWVQWLISLEIGRASCRERV